MKYNAKSNFDIEGNISAKNLMRKIPVRKITCAIDYLAQLLLSDSAISALEIDFSDARTFSKSISADSTFTIANDTNGMVKDVAITADTTDRVVTLPSAVKTTGSTTVTASTTSIFTFKKINDVIYCEIKSYT